MVDLPIKKGDLPIKNGDLPIKHGDLPIKNGDLPIKNGDLPIKHGDLPIKNGDLPINYMLNYQRVNIPLRTSDHVGIQCGSPPAAGQPASSPFSALSFSKTASTWSTGTPLENKN